LKTRAFYSLVAALLLFTSQASAVVINEASTNQDLGGEDFPFFFELYGDPFEPLTSTSLAIVSQNTVEGLGEPIAIISLDGLRLGKDGFLLIGNTAGVNSVQSVYGVTVDVVQETIIPLDLARSSALLLMNDADIPAGTFAGGEPVIDGMDFLGADRDGSPLAWTDVPVITDDVGFVIAGFRRNTDGLDTNAESDITPYVFVNGAISAPGDIATAGAVQADPTAAGSVPNIAINEASTNQDLGSADFPFFFELFGGVNEDLDGLALVAVSQNSTDGLGAVIASVSLAGRTTGFNGYFLIGNDDGDRDVVDIYNVVPNISQSVVPALNLARSHALLLMFESDIPGGAFDGSEAILDGFDFNGDARDGSPLSWAGVPVIADDAGFTVAGFRRNVEGSDTNGASDITAYVFQTGNITAPGDIATAGGTEADPTEGAFVASSQNWMSFE
jgi:hypothetical protein